MCDGTLPSSASFSFFYKDFMFVYISDMSSPPKSPLLDAHLLIWDNIQINLIYGSLNKKKASRILSLLHRYENSDEI